MNPQISDWTQRRPCLLCLSAAAMSASQWQPYLLFRGEHVCCASPALLQITPRRLLAAGYFLNWNVIQFLG